MVEPRDDAKPEFLTVLECAQLLRCGRSATYEAVKRGEIPSIRIGRRLRIPRAALDLTQTPRRGATKNGGHDEHHDQGAHPENEP